MRSLKIHFIYRSLFALLITALMVVLALTLTAVGALGDPGDENWTTFATGPDDGDINAITFDGAGNVYVGGAFTTISTTIPVTRTAMWDGSAWSAMGSGLDGTVRAMASDSAGNVYAVGGFTGGVAMWDGSTWSVVGGGVVGSPDVRGLAVDDADNVYIGGTFTSTATCATGCAHLAMWNGSTWSSVGGGLGSTSAVCRVNGLAYDPVGDNLYVAGQNACDIADPAGVNLTISRVAQWNFTSSTWSALCDPGPECGVSSNANSWAVDSKGNAYVAFGGSGAGSLTVNRIGKWDPTANSGAGGWAALCNGAECGSTTGGTGRVVAVDDADNVYFLVNRTTVGGVTVNYIAKWNPNANAGAGAWSAMGSGLGNDDVRSLGCQNGFLYAGGGFTTLGDASATMRLARWTAADGEVVSGTGDYAFYAPAAGSPPALPVTVTVTAQGDLARINIQRYDKDHITATASVQTGYYWEIEGLNASGGAASGFSVNLTLPAPGFTPNSNSMVCEYTAGGWDCAADSYDSSSITRDGITSFSDWAVAADAPLALGDAGNENWTAFPIGPGTSDGDVNAFAFDGAGNVYVGGAFAAISDTLPVTRTAMWDGSTWSAMGSGLGGTVRAMASDSAGNVYAVGSFTGGVAMWDGSTWSVVGGGVVGGTDVRGLAVDDADNVYVGGNFTGTVTCATGCAHLAMWNGSTWSSVGGGLGSTSAVCRVNGLAYDPVGDNLYVAGENACDIADPAGVNLTISRVAQWNFTSSTWSALCDPGPACGTSSNAYSWAVDSKGNAYVAFGGGGAGSLTVNRIGKWDPTANGGAGGWAALCNGTECGSTTGGTGRGVVVDDADNVYFMVNRTTVGGVTVNYIAKWNPNANAGAGAWSAMGSGLGNNDVRGIGYQNGFLYVGGGFTTLGDASATMRLARWTAADGEAVDGTGDYAFYAPAAGSPPALPVTVTVTAQGDLARIIMQRYDKSHDNATAPLQTGYYWEILGVNASGGAASGFSVNLTLPAPGFTPNGLDTVCEYTAGGWDCAADSYDSSSITRDGITSFSDWAVADVPVYTTYLPIIMRNQ